MNRGYSLIELLVTISLFALFAGFTLARFPRHNARVSLDLVAHNVALTVRQAQSYGLAVHNFADHDPANPFPGYGLNFKKCDTKSFTFFGDSSADLKYFPGSDCTTPPTVESGKEFFEQFKIPSGPVTIKDLCVNAASTIVPNNTPPAGGGACGKDTVNIVFKSPKPDANICSTLTPTGACTTASDVEIVLTNSRGDSRAIIVSGTGQISIK